MRAWSWCCSALSPPTDIHFNDIIIVFNALLVVHASDPFNIVNRWVTGIPCLSQ